MIRSVATLAAAMMLAPAAWAEAPSKCDVSTGLGINACTFPEGQIVIETDLIDRTVDHGGDLKTDSLLIGDTLVHVGLKHGLEAQVGWTPYDRENTRFKNGQRIHSSGIGDVTVGAKLQLIDPESHSIGLSFQPTISIPTGQLELGAAGIGGSLLLAASYDISDAVTLEITPQGDLVGDRTDDDRHWEYGATFGLNWAVSDAINATAEYRRFRQEDPSFRRTTNTAALSLGWYPVRKFQINAGAAKGLDHRSPKLQLLAGFALHLS